MRGVDHQDVHALLDYRHGALPSVPEDTDCSADPQPALRVLGGMRILVGLHEVLQGDQAPQASLLVNQWQLLDLVPGEQRERIVALGAHGGSDQRHRGHHRADQLVRIGLETHVTVGDDAEQHHVVVDDRHPADPVVGAQLLNLAQGGVGADGDRLINHAGLGALHLIDHVRLLADGQVPVQDAQATLAGHRDGHPLLGDGVHCRGQERHVQRDPPAEARPCGDLTRNDIGFARLQQHVVERQAESLEHRRHTGRSQQVGHRCPFGQVAEAPSLARSTTRSSGQATATAMVCTTGIGQPA